MKLSRTAGITLARVDPALPMAIVRRLRDARFGGLTEGPCGGTGRRARLKIEFRKECWFDSGQGHHLGIRPRPPTSVSPSKSRQTRRSPAAVVRPGLLVSAPSFGILAGSLLGCWYRDFGVESNLCRPRRTPI